MKQVTLALSLAGLSFLMTVIWGGPLLRILRHFKIGKIIRLDEPGHHGVKMGTPTMGGVMIILPVLFLTGLLNAVSLIGITQSGIGRSVLVPMIVMVGFAILGAVDDWEGIRGRRKGEGMRARTKFLFQVVLGLGTAWVLKYLLGVPDLFLPGIRGYFELGWWYRFCFTLVGAMFGFLWFNVHPAELFMGDTGSLAIGSTLAVVALMTSQWILLPIIAIIPFSEILSVVIQISYFRLTEGKRFFKMAPVHLHFELLGWSETQVVQRFWLIGLLAAMVGVGLALV